MTSLPSSHVRDRFPSFGRQCLTALATMVIVLVSSMVGDAVHAAIVYFPVSSGGSISQSGTGGPQVLLAFGSINLITGTFTIGTDNVNAPSFGVGLNPPDAPAASQFFAQTNDGVAWLLSSSTIALLSAGGTVGTGSYTSNDPNFGGDWKSGVSPGYAGLQMTSGTDTFYGWVSINYLVGSPNQATVNAFAFENQPNTPITVAAVPEPTTVALLAAGLPTAVAFEVSRRRRRRVRASRLRSANHT
jgi:hypothetical protein